MELHEKTNEHFKDKARKERGSPTVASHLSRRARPGLSDKLNQLKSERPQRR